MVADIDDHGEGEHGDDGTLVSQGESRDDIGGGSGLARFSQLLDRAIRERSHIPKINHFTQFVE